MFRRYHTMRTAKTPSQKARDKARQYFVRTGKTIRQWAKDNNVSEATVYEVIAGRKKCVRGDAHLVAVKLGIKKAPAAE